jgi:hypothetical protein
LLNPSISIKYQIGTAPAAEMMPSSHHGVITYPFSRPHVNAAPPIAGPIALPTAEIDTANPFSVPKILKLIAEFVNRITLHGNAKMTAKHLTSMMPNITVCCSNGRWMSAVYGVAKHMSGKVSAQPLKQFSTPNLRAVGGKTRNWMMQPMTPYSVNMVPILLLPRPKPPLNLNGRFVLLSFGVCRGWCRKMGRSWS